MATNKHWPIKNDHVQGLATDGTGGSVITNTYLNTVADAGPTQTVGALSAIGVCVISGWIVSAGTGRSFNVSAGSGIVSYLHDGTVTTHMFLETVSNSSNVNTLLPGPTTITADGTYYIMASMTWPTSVSNGVTSFFAQTSPTAPDGAVAIAVITISGAAVTNVSDLRPVLNRGGRTKYARYTTTANINLTGLATQAGLDYGSTMNPNDVVLVKNQTAGAENGLYQAQSGAWIRAADSDTSAEIIPGELTIVTSGATLADTIWQLTTEAPIVLATTALAYTRKDYPGINSLAAETAIASGDLIPIHDVSAGAERKITLANLIKGIPFNLPVAVTDETSVITAGTNKRIFRIPQGMTLTGVRANVTTPSSSGAIQVDINVSGVSILSAKLTIDQGEETSVTAATQPVISDPNLADDEKCSVDVDNAGTGAVGLKITLYYLPA